MSRYKQFYGQVSYAILGPGKVNIFTEPRHILTRRHSFVCKIVFRASGWTVSLPSLKHEQQQSPLLDSYGHITDLRATCVDTDLHLPRVAGVSGARDEQRSVLNVPLRLTRLSVRMIPGLISPPDWI